MSDGNCPYCGADIEINHDDGQGYTEDVFHQQECGKCGKTFVFSTTIHFSYDLAKADCLNEGGEHTWKRTHTIPVIFTKMRCTQCGEERELTKEEKETVFTDKEKLEIKNEPWNLRT